MLVPGSTILCQDQQYKLVDILDLHHVLAEDAKGVQRKLAVRDLKVPPSKKRHLGDLASLEPLALQAALHALKALKLLAAVPRHSRSTAKVDEVAVLFERGRSTIYRWLDRYERGPSISALMRKRRSDAGKSRLAEDIEKVIQGEIHDYYLTLNRPSITSTFKNIEQKCQARNLPVPDLSTVRDRIHQLDPRLVEEKRYGPKSASERFDPLKGSFPNANFPLAVVQIDHTPFDVIVVDDKWRKPIGRPFLTVAMDVRTKMVVGFYISLERPGALATGLCLSRAMLAKEKYLQGLGLGEYEWPCWGKMRTIHSDNAKEFKGTMLGWAAQEHGINPERRPLGQPKYGGHIERGFRTWMAKVHEELPGTTFSSVHDKFDYDAEGHAVMTLKALEKWFTMYILGIYHQEPHKGNDGIPPHVLWHRLLLEGTDTEPPAGLPSPVEDEEQLRLDFLPCFKRSIQVYGVQNWNLHWYTDALRHLIHARDPDKPNEKKQFICRYDPRDLSKIWIYDDRHRIYLEVGFRDKTRPPVSLWEVKEATRLAKEDSGQSVNQERIFRTIAAMRKLVESESEKTKKARRQHQRQKDWEDSRAKKPVGAKPTAPPPLSTEPNEGDLDAFTEIYDE